MKWSFVFLLIVSAGFTSSAQVRKVLPDEIRKIRLLESTREDVRRIFRNYELFVADQYEHEFSKEGITINVTFSRGTCTADSDDEDASEIWNVGEGKVTRIEISLDEPVKLEGSGLFLSNFRKEPRYPNDFDSMVIHNKNAGFAIKTIEEGLETIIIFPPLAYKTRLCKNSSASRGFYVRRSWFSLEKPFDFIECVNDHANVDKLELGANEIDSTADHLISVVTTATDPENDILTYNYIVSAGKIIGTGPKVVWDLIGVPAGTYTITVGVDDGAGVVGKTIMKTVTIK